MRKIETQEIIDARAQRNKKFLTIFMLIILLGSTAGYAFLSFDSGGSGDGTNVVNGQEQDVSGKWVLDINGQKVYITNSRNDVQNISVNIGTTSRDFAGKTVYISSDSQLAYSELIYPLSAFASRVQEACYGKCDKNLPEKNCTDNLIVFEQSDVGKISQSENCIFISGSLREIDAFIYKLFGS
jgi:hypothetical protein